MGAFQSQFAMVLSTFDDNFPQNGSKNGAERGWDNPTKGLLWGTAKAPTDLSSKKRV